MADPVQDFTFHIYNKDKSMYVSYDNKWYRISFSEVNKDDNIFKGNQNNIRINPDCGFNPIEYLLKTHLINKNNKEL